MVPRYSYIHKFFIILRVPKGPLPLWYQYLRLSLTNFNVNGSLLLNSPISPSIVTSNDSLLVRPPTNIISSPKKLWLLSVNPNTQELLFLKTVYIFYAHKAWCNHWIPVVNNKKPDHSIRSAQLTLEPCPGCHLHNVDITKPSRTTRLDPLFCDLEIDLLQA